MRKTSKSKQAENSYDSSFDFLLGGYSIFSGATLLTSAAHYYLKGLESIASKNNLSNSRFSTLWLLYIAQVSLTATKLARLLMIEPHAVSRMLTKLEQQKLIKRIRSKEDRRNWHVSLTPKGKELIEEAFPEVTKFAKQIFGETLSKSELTTFIRSTAKIRNACYKWLGEDIHDFKNDEAALINALRSFPEYRVSD